MFISRSASSKWFVALAGFLATCGAIAGYVLNRPRPVPLLGPETVTIAPGIHMLGELAPSAAYAIETTQGLILVDTGLESDAWQLKTQLRKLGLDWKKLHAIFLTHAHGDHCGGAASLRESTNAKIYAGRGDSDVLRAGSPREAFFSIFHMPNDAPHPTPVDVELSGGEEFDFGDVRIQAISTPGHTPGSVCYLVERGGQRALFAGDVISYLVGVVEPYASGRNPLGTYSAYLAPRFRGDARDYLASLQKLRDLPLPDFVLPGHPRSDPSPQSPRLTEARWRAMLDQGISDLEMLIRRFDADGADFLDGEPKAILPSLYYLGDYEGQAVYGLLAAERFLLVNAPGGAGLSDFVRATLQRLEIDAPAPTAVLITSLDQHEMTGLSDLIATHSLSVIAPADSVPDIKKVCPPGTNVLSVGELETQGWLPVTTRVLRGRGAPQAAYVLPWHGKTVLISGTIPASPDQGPTERLFDELAKSPTSVMDYLVSVHAIEDVNPDVWLPAVPSNAQNANLYEGQWKDVVATNFRTAMKVVEQKP